MPYISNDGPILKDFSSSLLALSLLTLAFLAPAKNSTISAAIYAFGLKVDKMEALAAEYHRPTFASGFGQF